MAHWLLNARGSFGARQGAAEASSQCTTFEHEMQHTQEACPGGAGHMFAHYTTLRWRCNLQASWNEHKLLCWALHAVCSHSASCLTCTSLSHILQIQSCPSPPPLLLQRPPFVWQLLCLPWAAWLPWQVPPAHQKAPAQQGRLIRPQAGGDLWLVLVAGAKNYAITVQDNMQGEAMQCTSSLSDCLLRFLP